MEKLNVLDLFSGIAGNTLGLSEYTKTIAYCEGDRHAQSVLYTWPLFLCSSLSKFGVNRQIVGVVESRHPHRSQLSLRDPKPVHTLILTVKGALGLGAFSTKTN